MDIFVLNPVQQKCEQPKQPDPPKKQKVPIGKIFFIFFGILATVLAILCYVGYSKELVECIAGVGIASDVLMYILVSILAGEPNGNFWRKLGYAVPLLLIIDAVGGYFVYTYCFPHPKQPAPEQPIEYINQRLTYLQIESSRLEFCQPPTTRSSSYQSMNAVFVPVPSEQPKSQYLITIKENTLIPFYLFEDRRYKLETSRFRQSEAGQICRFIDNCYDEKDPIVVSLRKLREGMPRLPGIGCLNINVPDVMIELIYILRKLSKANTRVEILIRGYADGRGGEWEEPIFWGSKYAFHDFRIYRAAQPGPSNHFEGLYYPDTYHVEDYYMNKDLPNLRARFVQLDLIEPLISECSMSPAVSTYVIDGQVTPGFDPLNRRVEIYILLF